MLCAWRPTVWQAVLGMPRSRRAACCPRCGRSVVSRCWSGARACWRCSAGACRSARRGLRPGPHRWRHTASRSTRSSAPGARWDSVWYLAVAHYGLRRGSGAARVLPAVPAPAAGAGIGHRRGHRALAGVLRGRCGVPLPPDGARARRGGGRPGGDGARALPGLAVLLDGLQRGAVPRALGRGGVRRAHRALGVGGRARRACGRDAQRRRRAARPARAAVVGALAPGARRRVAGARPCRPRGLLRRARAGRTRRAGAVRRPAAAGTARSPARSSACGTGRSPRGTARGSCCRARACPRTSHRPAGTRSPPPRTTWASSRSWCRRSPPWSASHGGCRPPTWLTWSPRSRCRCRGRWHRSR